MKNKISNCQGRYRDQERLPRRGDEYMKCFWMEIHLIKVKGIKDVSHRRNPGSKLEREGTSLVVQRLRVHTLTAGHAGLIPGLGAKILRDVGQGHKKGEGA